MNLQSDINEKFKKVNYTINGMFSNENHSLLSLATDKGYKIFESYNLRQVSEEDEIIELLGDLKIVIPFYESNTVVFVGSDENLNFPSTQVVVWDDIKRKKIGLIMLKEKIYSLKVHREGIYIQIFNKILVFDLITLNYLFTLIDVNCLSSDKLITSHESNPVVLAYQPATRLYQLKIAKLQLDSDYQIIGKIQYVLTTPFKLITKYNLSNKGNIAIVVGDMNNKIHIYSLNDFGLKYCLDSSHPLNRITNISISKKNKFFSILYDDYNLEIYNLVEEKKINSNCECVNSLIENKKDNDTGGYFSKKFLAGAMKKIQKLFIQQSRKSFAKYKFNPFSDMHFLTESDIQNLENENKFTLINFEKINEIIITDSRGILEKIKFNTKEGGYCWCYKNVSWLSSEKKQYGGGEILNSINNLDF